MVNKYYQKNKKSFGKKHVKYIKISLKNKNTKGEKKARERYHNFTEEEKERHQYYQECKKKLPEYRRNYYLTHKK